MSLLRPFFPFYGAKWRIGARYPPPRYPILIEPFAGAAGYAMHYPDRRVTLVDLDEKIIGTWQYLIRVSEDEIRKLPLIHYGQSIDDLNVCEEAGWLIGWWLNAGTSSPRKTPSRWMRDSLTTGSFWGAGVRERIASQLGAIRHWNVWQGTYTGVSNVTATWFIDAPYVGAGQDYRYNSRLIDYTSLAGWCRSRRGQVLVCEHVGADWLPFEPFYLAKAAPGRYRSGVSKEALWEGGQHC